MTALCGLLDILTGYVLLAWIGQLSPAEVEGLNAMLVSWTHSIAYVAIVACHGVAIACLWYGYYGIGLSTVGLGWLTTLLLSLTA